MTLHPGQRNTSVLELKSPQLEPARYSFPENIEWFQDLIEHTQDLLCVHDLQGRLLAVNRAPARLLGHTVEEILSIPMRELIVPEHRKEFDDYLRRIEREGHVRGLLVVQTRSGERRTWEFRNTLRHDRDGNPIVSGIARDVTEQRRAELLLQEAGELNRQIIASANEGMVVYDRDLRCLVWNPFMEELTGILSSDALGKSYADLVPSWVSGHDPGVELKRALAGEMVAVPDQKIPLAAGQRWLSSRKGPLRNAEGQIIGVIVTLRDITDRKQAEEALRTNELHYHKIAEQLEAERARLIEAQAVAKVGSWEVELPSLEITWSQQTHRIFETDPSHFHPRRPDFVEFIHKEDRAKVDAAFQASLDKDAPSNVEYRIVMPDERVKVLEERWKVFHDEQGRPVRLMGTCRDITERKQAEDALRRSEENYRVFVSQSSEGIFREELSPPASIDLPEEELVRRILYNAYIAECNDALAAMYGLKSAEQLLGRYWKDLLLPEDQHNIEMIRQFVRSGFRLIEHRSHEVDIHGQHKIFLNSLIGTVENGALVRTWGIQRDITEKVRLEAAREEISNNLKQNVVELERIREELKLAKEKLALEKLYLEEEIDTDLGFGEIIGRSRELQLVMEKVKKVAPSDAAVLLLGETGTGKELVARELHRRSSRAGKSFIKMNCAAIPSGLLESELFGHEKGAFTGAVARKLGRLELADGGTLFLDEIGEIPLSLQPKLLRVLQDMEFERLGGTQTLKVNFRLLAATNRDLAQSVKAREFRSDLYYRLNVFPILIPRLRERREDIRLLVEHFLQKFSAQMKKKITHIPSKTMEALVRWDWPGNVRELENFLERSVILTSGSVLQAPLAELDVSEHKRDDEPATLEDIGRDRILRALRACHGKLGGADGAAARLGLKRTTLQSKLDQLGIHPAEFRA